MTREGRTAERVARNDSIFRDANEGIRAAAGEHGLDGPIPFICECADERCTQIIRLDLREYERIRSRPKRFVTAPGHRAKSEPEAVSIERQDGYEVIEKTGRTGEIAAEADPRS